MILTCSYEYHLNVYINIFRTSHLLTFSGFIKHNTMLVSLFFSLSLSVFLSLRLSLVLALSFQLFIFFQRDCSLEAA